MEYGAWLRANAQKIEAVITQFGDDPLADELVRERVQSAILLALGQWSERGETRFWHCRVPVGTTVIAMLPVFTRTEHVATAVRMNPTLGDLLMFEVSGSEALGYLDPDEYLAINPWSEREFKLAATSNASNESPGDEFWPNIGFWARLKRAFMRGYSGGRGPR